MPERAGEQSIWTIHSFSTASMLMQTKRIQKGEKGNSMRGKEKEIGLAPAAWSIVLATCEVYNFKLPAPREVTAGRGVTFHDRPYISKKDIIVPCTCGAQPLKIKAGVHFHTIYWNRNSFLGFPRTPTSIRNTRPPYRTDCGNRSSSRVSLAEVMKSSVPTKAGHVGFRVGKSICPMS